MFKKRIILFFILAIFSLTSSSLLFAQQKLISLSCDVIMEISSQGTSQGKMYLKKDKFRFERQIPAKQDTRIITIVNENNVYLYYPSKNMAVVIPVYQAKQQMPVDLNTDFKKKFKYIGEEMVDGKLCDVYLDDKESLLTKFWVAKDLDFPIKVSNSKMTIHYKNINKNATLNDDLFSLPPGVAVQDMQPMVQNMQEMMKNMPADMNKAIQKGEMPNFDSEKIKEEMQKMKEYYQNQKAGKSENDYKR